MGMVTDRLAALGLELPQAARPVAAYVPTVRTGSHVYVSGQLPMREGKLVWTGKVGAEVSVDEAKEAARLCCVNALAAVAAEIGDLDRVVRVVKVTGFVAGAQGFTAQPSVVNGASELLRDVFGPAGEHARSAVGVAELPFGATVEVEMILEVK